MALKASKKRVDDGPSKASLAEMPETDFSKVRVRRNPYAERIKKGGGYWVRVT